MKFKIIGKEFEAKDMDCAEDQFHSDPEYYADIVEVKE